MNLNRNNSENNVTYKWNPFWENVLKRVSEGDAPYGTKIQDDQLIYKNYQLSLKNSTSEQVVEFFKHTVGLDLQYIHFDNWKEIKRKSIKDNLIQNYIQQFSLKHKLTPKQSEYLSSLIHLFITLKKIPPSDIILDTDCIDEYNHTFIKSINSISFQNNTIIFNPNHESDSDSDTDSSNESYFDDESIEDELFLEDDNIE
jgi:hypothetical protein